VTRRTVRVARALAALVAHLAAVYALGQRLAREEEFR
jgi:hypothetical protein